MSQPGPKRITRAIFALLNAILALIFSVVLAPILSAVLAHIFSAVLAPYLVLLWSPYLGAVLARIYTLCCFGPHT